MNLNVYQFFKQFNQQIEGLQDGIQSVTKVPDCIKNGQNKLTEEGTDLTLEMSGVYKMKGKLNCT